jgi:hypothetical protein
MRWLSQPVSNPIDGAIATIRAPSSVNSSSCCRAQRGRRRLNPAHATLPPDARQARHDEILETDGNPLVYAARNAGASRTLLFTPTRWPADQPAA